MADRFSPNNISTRYSYPTSATPTLPPSDTPFNKPVELVAPNVVRVSSSVIAFIIYPFGSERVKNALTLVFNTGRVYQYADVPVWDAVRLVEADSTGTYYNERIKGRFYSKEL